MMACCLGFPTLGEDRVSDVAALVYLFTHFCPSHLWVGVCVFEVRRSSSSLQFRVHFQHLLLPLLAVHRCSQKLVFRRNR